LYTDSCMVPQVIEHTCNENWGLPHHHMLIYSGALICWNFKLGDLWGCTTQLEQGASNDMGLGTNGMQQSFRLQYFSIAQHYIMVWKI